MFKVISKYYINNFEKIKMEILFKIRNLIVSQLFKVPKPWSLIVNIVRQPFLISVIVYSPEVG